MKRNISKKTKTLMSSATALLAVTSVVAPLSMAMTSCNNPEKMMEDQLDKEYGVTEATYNNLKDQLFAKYKAKLTNSAIIGEEAQRPYINYLTRQLNSLDSLKTSGKHSFTTLTTSMIQFAKTRTDLHGQPYSIDLNAKTRANWSQLDSMFNSWNSSFRQYMINSDMSPITVERVLKDARNNFNSLKQELKSQFPHNPLSGIIYGKEKMITCFESVNDEIALVSSTLRLKDFMSQYVFETNQTAAACLDNLTTKGNPYYDENFQVGNVLLDSTMQKLFTITRKDDGEKVLFSSNMVKGYTLQPKLTKISTNKYSNIHTFSIDFGLVKSSYIRKYKDPNKLASVTAHRYSADNWDFSDVNDNTSLSTMISRLEIQNTEYPIYLSEQGEQDALAETYFNKNSKDGYISFVWDNNNANNQAYESFFDNAKKDPLTGIWTASLENPSLSNTGLMISNNKTNKSSYKFIKDVLKSLETDTENPENNMASDLTEKFLSTCELSSDISINENDAKQKVVSINFFYAKYANSIYKKEGKLELKNTDDYKIYQKQCVNHQVSKQFFEKVNTKFNNVVDFVTIYDPSIINYVKTKNNEAVTQSGLDELASDSDTEFFSATASLVVGTVAISAVIISIWAPWNPSGRNKLINAVTAVLLTASLIGQAAMYALWMRNYYTPMQDYLEAHRDFKESTEEDPLIDTLKTSLEQNYVLIRNDGTYDKDEFETKKKNFNFGQGHTMEWMLNEYRSYASIQNVSSPLNWAWDKYQKKLKKFKVDPEVLKEKISGWNAGGKYWMISIGISIATIFAGIVLAFWIRSTKAKQDLADEQVKKSQEAYAKKVDERFEKFSSQVAETFADLAKTSAGSFGGYGQPPLALAMQIWELVTGIFEQKIWQNRTEHYSPERTTRAQELREKINGKYTPDGKQEWDIEWIVDHCIK